MKKGVVLVVFPHLGMGGVEKSLEFVSNTYAESGYSVHAVSLSEDKSIHVKLKAGIPITHLPLPKGSISRLTFVLRLRGLIRKISPEVIIVFRADITRIVVYAAWNMGIKIISSERGNPERYSTIQLKKYEKAFSRCSKVVFQTKYASSFFSDVVIKKCSIIPNPCLLKNKPHMPEEKREKIILSCGRLSSEKNFEGLIRAFAMITNEIPSYKLVIYGDGPEREKLERLARDLHCGGIKILHTVSNVFAEAGTAALFVMNSFAEGMPNALIEAMANGIPCISTDCPGGIIEHLADEGRRICLVPRGDDKKLADAMLMLLLDPDKAMSLANSAIEIKETLCPNKIGDMWLKLLEEL